MPSALRPAELAARPIHPDATKVIDAEWSDDSISVRSAEDRDDLLRLERAENARLKVELERKGREVALPSPRRDRERMPTEGYLPGMPESMPPPRSKLESHEHLHIDLSGLRVQRDDTLPPKSARQRAGEALKGARQPLIVTLISTLLSSGGVTAYVASKGQQPTPDPTAAAGYALLKSEVERQAAEQRRQAEQQAQFQGWILGFLRATGTRVDAPPGAPTPTQVEIRATPAPTASVAPIMASRKRGGAPQPARVEVLTPPPPSLPPPKAPDLPERIGP
jgi:hypothetical protein